MGGVRIGYFDKNFNRPMRYPGNAGHLVTVAPTGSGKTRDVLIPALLDESSRDMSCLVIDPKGQLASVTGPHAARMGKRVIMLNPFGIWPECIGKDAESFKGLSERCDFNGTYNPCAKLDPSSDDFVLDAEGLGQAIVYSEGSSGGSENSAFFNDSARDLVTGLMMYAALEEETGEPAAEGIAPINNLAWVRSVICNRERLYAAAAMAMTKGDEFVAQKLSRFTKENAEDSKEISSIISTAISQTSFIGNAALGRNLSVSSFQFRDLRSRPTVIYLILPGKRLKTCARWFRLVVASALDELFTEQKEKGLSVLFMLEEFAQLGPMKVIEDCFGIARDYNLLMWPVLQDLNQLKRDYPHSWETMLANSGMLQFFRPQDNTTAEYVSKRCAQVEVLAHMKKTISESVDMPGHMNVSVAPEYKDKKFLEPWEVAEIGMDEFLMFAAGKNGVYRGARRAWWEAPELKDLGSPDPFHPGARKNGEPIPKDIRSDIQTEYNRVAEIADRLERDPRMRALMPRWWKFW